MSGVLVLVTGTGRSGTSTITGTLHHLGLYVPGPYLGANKSNPKGFFESSWAVRFHKRLTKKARINEVDSRPYAFDRVQAAITPEVRAELVAFLAEHAAEHDQVVVKDPRTAWVQALWKDAAAEAGLEIRYLTMLRHPAEVVGSRTTYYANPADDAARRRYETFNVARWVNCSLVSERETRGEPRTFVRYTDLLEDWRPVVARVRDELGLRLNTDLAVGEHHPVDDFIDPDLRRHKVTWDELDTPKPLESIAEEVWQDLMVLHDEAGVNDMASQDLDRLSGRYERLYQDSLALSHEAIEEVKEEAQKLGAQRVRERQRERERQQREPRQGPPRIDEAGGRQLATELAKRVKRRVKDQQERVRRHLPERG